MTAAATPQGRAQSPAPITRSHNGQLPPERLAALTAACLLIDDIDDAGPRRPSPLPSQIIHSG